MLIKWLAIIGISIVFCIGLAVLYGRDRWQSETDSLRAKLTSGRRIIKPKIYDQKEIEDLIIRRPLVNLARKLSVSDCQRSRP